MDTDRPHTCSKCKNGFSKVEYLQDHIRRCFSEEEAESWNLKCNICYEAGKLKKSLMATELGLLQHRNMIHQEFVPCPFENCNAQVGRLAHHLASKHPEFYNQVGVNGTFYPLESDFPPI